MSYPPSSPRLNAPEAIVRLTAFLQDAREPYDLLHLLDHPLLINPSDLYSIVDCETRLRGYSGDRTVSAMIFFIDLHQEMNARVDCREAEIQITEIFSAVLRALIEHYHRPNPQRMLVMDALQLLEQFGCRELIQESFERRFRDWRQMMKSARRLRQAGVSEDSREYGLLPRGTIIADRIGNMLSHVRHLYCDVAFPTVTFCLE